jgi:hypothetical protein
MEAKEVTMSQQTVSVPQPDDAVRDYLAAVDAAAERCYQLTEEFSNALRPVHDAYQRIPLASRRGLCPPGDALKVPLFRPVERKFEACPVPEDGVQGAPVIPITPAGNSCQAAQTMQANKAAE